MIDDMDDMMLRVIYSKILADTDQPLPLPFEQWRKEYE